MQPSNRNRASIVALSEHLIQNIGDLVVVVVTGLVSTGFSIMLSIRYLSYNYASKSPELGLASVCTVYLLVLSLLDNKSAQKSMAGSAG
jgi:hypothetical protein